MDLVGPGPLAPHFEDARGAVEGLDARGDWADLGSGAGFPGVAVAGAFPDARVALVESREKRAIFLDKVVAEAKLDNATVARTRTEALPDGSLDGVISRAYKPPPLFLEDADRLLRPNGVAALMLGDDPDFALPDGWVEVSRHRYAVPDGFRLRVVARRA